MKRMDSNVFSFLYITKDDAEESRLLLVKTLCDEIKQLGGP